MKKLSIFLLALFASAGITQAAIIDGSCGPNLTWSLNTKDSTLTIEGTGNMYSYYPSSDEPWAPYKSYIKHLSFSEGLKSISRYAFSSCSNLTSVTIPNSVTSIGESAFYDCNKLTRVNIQDLSAWCAISFGNGLSNPLYYAHLYLGDSKIIELIIPNDVTSIGNYAFVDCSFLTSVTIPNSVTSIGRSAFSNCSGLRSIEIPNSVTSIGSGAFYWCEITSIEIPKSVTSIGSYAFYNFDGLRSVTCKAITPPTCDANVFNIEKTTQTLSVPSISIDAYKNALVWEDFTNIVALPAQNPIVKFVDWDGTVLAVEEVDEGSAATPPTNPSREGYTFTGWDKDFSNVIEDMIVTAQYQINRYRVQFLDWDNTLLKTDSVDWSAAATPPANPIRTGYTFSEWDKDFTSVKSDLEVNAIYAINYYPVVFLDWNGSILSEQNIAYESSATLPSSPQREGYTFIGWSSEAHNIIDRTFVVAQYEKKQIGAIPVSFAGIDGNILLNSFVIDNAPEAPEIEGFTFLGWQPKAEFIDEIIEIQAIYKSDSEAATQVVANPSNPSQKLIRNGSVYILTDDSRTYTLTGQQVK